MSDHLSKLIPLAVLAASLLGSLHCVSMCGGLVTAIVRTPGQAVRYHFGRLAGYLALGLLAGLIGQEFLAFDGETPLRQITGWVSAIGLAGALVWIGVRSWKGKGAHLFHFSPGWARKAIRSGSPFLAGIGTALLPCGWLHTFLLGAVATRSPVYGAIYLGFFWLGTVPALASTPWLVGRVLRPIAQRFPKAVAILLISAGVMTLSAKVVALHAPAQKHCHCEH